MGLPSKPSAGDWAYNNSTVRELEDEKEILILRAKAEAFDSIKTQAQADGTDEDLASYVRLVVSTTRTK